MSIAWEAEEWEKGTEELDHGILSMPFHQRWAVVGSRSSESLADSLAPSLSSTAFSRVASSFKLNTISRNVSTPEMVLPGFDLGSPLPANRKGPNRRLEPGSPDRLLKKGCKVAFQQETNAMRVDRKNPILDVEKGLSAYSVGDEKVVKQVRRSRLSLIRTDDLCKHKDAPKKSSATDIRKTRRVRTGNDTRGQRVALSEFNVWCTSTFGDLEKSWAYVDPLGQRNIGKVDFIDRFSKYRYPKGILGIKNVFFHLDRDDDDLVHEDEFCITL